MPTSLLLVDTWCSFGWLWPFGMSQRGPDRQGWSECSCVHPCAVVWGQNLLSLFRAHISFWNPESAHSCGRVGGRWGEKEEQTAWWAGGGWGPRHRWKATDTESSLPRLSLIRINIPSLHALDATCTGTDSLSLLRLWPRCWTPALQGALRKV